jgi:hypothetical protein
MQALIIPEGRRQLEGCGEKRLPSSFLALKTGVKELELGIPTYGERKSLDEQAHDELRREGILENKRDITGLKISLPAHTSK